MVLGVVNGV